MNLVLGQDKAVADWVAARIPHVDEFEAMAAIGIRSSDGCDLGAVVYHEYRGNDIQMSCASEAKRWLSSGVLRALFSYPFKQLNVDRVTAFAPARNSHTRKFLERIGFKQEGIMRRGFPDDDCIVYGMLKEECNWIQEKKNGKT